MVWLIPQVNNTWSDSSHKYIIHGLTHPSSIIIIIHGLPFNSGSSILLPCGFNFFYWAYINSRSTLNCSEFLIFHRWSEKSDIMFTIHRTNTVFIKIMKRYFVNDVSERYAYYISWRRRGELYFIFQLLTSIIILLIEFRCAFSIFF